ncbi:MAG: ATP-binding protein, partial [Salinisphaera sp.]|nr:ATP-binding protein [Salinisphaera sp.]
MAARLHAVQYRLAAVILTAAFAIALLTTVLVARSDTHSRVTSTQALAHSLIEQLARSGHLALIAGDHEELRKIAGTVVQASPLIATVTIRDDRAEPVIRLQSPLPPAGWLDRALARLTTALAQPELQMAYRSQIPPPGEGTILGLFGTPRADIGSARITLSPAAWTTLLATVMERALWIGLLVFTSLALTGIAAIWVAARRLAALRLRLRELSGNETDSADIDHSIAAIGARLTRSEALARDATETLRSREAELAQARAHAEDAARMRADLVAGMSHELRAPLTAILGHTDLLYRGSLSRSQREHVTTVEGAARNLLSLIDDVIQWSGLESGRTTLNEVGFRLAETVEDTLGLLAPLAFEKDLELVLLVYREVPARVRGDPLRLQQLLTNLVSNAIKFTAEGSVVVRVMVEDENTAQVQLVVRVSDTGPGISAADRARLFTMYGRLQPGSSNAGGGLGLAICKRLLEMMGGSIALESEPGRGSDFSFRLPLAKVGPRQAGEAPWTGLEDLRILVAEPDETAATALSHHLQAWQTQVESVSDFASLAQRLQEAQTPRWDLALIGLRGSNVDAQSLHGALALLKRKQVPTLTLVTSIDDAVHQRLIDAGATRSLPKTPSRLRLFETLRTLSGATDPAGADQPLQGVQALVADDSAGSRRFVAAMLADLGAEVAQAADGKAAVDAWRKGGFPLLLLDDQMPGCDGVEATRQIRSLAVSGAATIILGMTASNDPATARQFLAAGADACLVKPFDSTRVLRYAGRLVTERRTTAPGPDPGHKRAADLVDDSRLAALLADELPTQLAAVTNALDVQDLDAGRREIHTLHGTAAFYGLSELRTAAREIEQTLLDDKFPAPAKVEHLRAANAAAIASLQAVRD